MNDKAITIENLRILKIGTCPSLTRASQITYHLVLKEDDDQVYLRIAGNSGGGLFAKECVPLDAIITAIQGDHPITGKTLRPLFQGKSANTPGFALAAARDLGLIVARPGPARMAVIQEVMPNPAGRKSPPSSLPGQPSPSPSIGARSPW